MSNAEQQGRIDRDVPTGDQAFVIRIEDHEGHRLKVATTFEEIAQLDMDEGPLAVFDGITGHEVVIEHYPWGLERVLATKANGLIGTMLSAHKSPSRDS